MQVIVVCINDFFRSISPIYTCSLMLLSISRVNRIAWLEYFCCFSFSIEMQINPTALLSTLQENQSYCTTGAYFLISLLIQFINHHTSSANRNRLVASFALLAGCLPPLCRPIVVEMARDMKAPYREPLLARIGEEGDWLGLD